MPTTPQNRRPANGGRPAGPCCIEGGQWYDTFDRDVSGNGRSMRFELVRVGPATQTNARQHTPARHPRHSLHSLLRRAGRYLLGLGRALSAREDRVPPDNSGPAGMSHNAYRVTYGENPKVCGPNFRVKPEDSDSGCYGWRSSQNGCIVCELRYHRNSGQAVDMAAKRLILSAGEAVHHELNARPIIRERVMRYLNEENQLRLSQHIGTTSMVRLYQAKIIPTPWGVYINRFEMLEYAIAIIESEKGDSAMLQEVEWILRRMLEAMEELRQSPRGPEPFWIEARKQWYRERGFRE